MRQGPYRYPATTPDQPEILTAAIATGDASAERSARVIVPTQAYVVAAYIALGAGFVADAKHWTFEVLGAGDVVIAEGDIQAGLAANTALALTLGDDVDLDPGEVVRLVATPTDETAEDLPDVAFTLAVTAR